MWNETAKRLWSNFNEIIVMSHRRQRHQQMCFAVINVRWTQVSSFCGHTEITTCAHRKRTAQKKNPMKVHSKMTIIIVHILFRAQNIRNWNVQRMFANRWTLKKCVNGNVKIVHTASEHIDFHWNGKETNTVRLRSVSVHRRLCVEKSRERNNRA